MHIYHAVTRPNKWTSIHEADCGQTDTCENITFPLWSVKISSILQTEPNRYFCWFRASREYLAIRGNYVNDNDPFFVLGIILHCIQSK